MRFAVSFALLLAVGIALGAEPKAKPNVVVIVADELGPRDLGCTGSTYYKTPNLDAFAKSGVKLEEAYVGTFPQWVPFATESSDKLVKAPSVLAPHVGQFGFEPNGYRTIAPTEWDDADFRAELKLRTDGPLFAYFKLAVVPTAERIASYKSGKIGSQGNPAYAARVEAIDRTFGEIVKAVDDVLGSDPAIVIFTSARSGNSVEWKSGVPTTSNAPYREGSGYLYEGGLRVPFLIRGPGIKSVAIAIAMDDLLPTIAGFCHTKIDPKSRGVDLSPQFRGEAKPDASRPLHWHSPSYSQTFAKPGGAIRVGNLKLIESFEDGRFELFDLSKDLGESRNLAAEKPEVVKEMAAKLAAWRKEVGAKLPTPNPDYKPNPQDKDGTIALHARTASVTGVQLRFEPAPHKNTLGYWTNAADTASFDFTVTNPGTFTVSVLQGAGKGSGGAEVELAVGESKAKFTVKDTGGFQAFELREVGELTIDKAGLRKLTVAAKTKPGVAVMDLREVVLKRKKG